MKQQERELEDSSDANRSNPVTISNRSNANRRNPANPTSSVLMNILVIIGFGVFAYLVKAVVINIIEQG